MSATLLLGACKSDEERAEEYYQSGLDLLEAGDVPRAMIEFRNVFDLNGFHFKARKTYADLLLEQGDTRQGYSQLLRLIEQYPDTLAVRQQLTDIAIMRGDWEEAERHGQAAIALAPDDPGSQAIAIALRYRQALQDNDTAAADAAAADARAIVAGQREAGTAPENAILARIDLDNLMNRDRIDDALAAVDAVLVSEPAAMDLHAMKLQLLSQAGDMAAIGTQLEEMAALFPDDEDVRQNLIRWYVNQGDNDAAIAYLRELAGPADNPDPEGHLTLVEFLRVTQGPAAARAELLALRDAAAGMPTGRRYAGALAALDFETGEMEEGIAQMRAALDGAPQDDATRQLQVIMAKMLAAIGAREEAETLVGTILKADPGNVEALKLQASWLILDDKVGDAIVALRRALDQNPQDSQTLTLLAQAHQRDGDMDLAGERLATAVQVSNAAPAESLRYAGFLTGRDQAAAAVSVLEDARRQAPENTDVLTSLADLYIRNRDFALAQQVIDTLRGIDTTAAEAAVPLLQAAILQGQDRTADSLAILEGVVDPAAISSDQSAARAVALILQTQIRSGKIAEARSYLDGLLAASPDDANMAMIDASLSSLEGDTAAAEEKYRALMARFPQSEVPVQFLVGLLLGDGRDAEAMQTIDAAVATVANPGELLLMKAGLLEKAGDVDAAIAVYEEMYAADSSNVVIANNLASMISSYRDDEDGLARAATIARRLRDTTVPAFADTFGWIAFRRGNVEEALPYLEMAAAGLPDDPLVQIHLGLARAARGQTEEARAVLTRAIDLAGDSTLPQVLTARETLAGLPAVPAQNP